MIRRTLAALLLVPLVLAGACSSDDDDGGGDVKPADGPDLSDVQFQDATGSSGVEVSVRDNSYAPQYLEVKAGTTITFTNQGRTEHNVYPADDGAFTPIDATDLEPKDTVTLTLDEPGDVPYYCTLHGSTTKGMIGAFRVVE